MALTPDDVVHKRFETTRFRDGYDQDEVDDFLDEVVTELRRLTEENESLRAENEQLQSGSSAAAPARATQKNIPAPSAARTTACNKDMGAESMPAPDNPGLALTCPP